MTTRWRQSACDHLGGVLSAASRGGGAFNPKARPPKESELNLWGLGVPSHRVFLGLCVLPWLFLELGTRTKGMLDSAFPVVLVLPQE